MIPKGTRADIINAWLKCSFLWNNVEKLYLRTNMRVYSCGGADIFSSQLLKIGNRTLENKYGFISVNHTSGRVLNNVEMLIYEVCPDIFNLSNKSYQWLCEYVKELLSLQEMYQQKISMTSFFKNCMETHVNAVILIGPVKGEIAFILGIPMIPTNLPLSFKRLKFPVKVSFAITINKTQSQTFRYVGVDLRLESFSNGQYVGFS
jgi:hypothetical protein